MFFKKLIIKLPFNSASLSLGIYSKEIKSLYGTTVCNCMFTAELFTRTKVWNQLRYPSVNAWVSKMWHHEILLSHKNEILSFVTRWINLESILTEISQAQKEKYHMISLSCRI
jgi:hypothetical protein